MRVALLFLIAFLVGCTPSRAQDRTTTSDERVSFTFTGGIHVRTSFGRQHAGSDSSDRIGLGLRRARFRADVKYDGRAGMIFQLDGASGSASLLDFYAYYDVSPTLRVRAGRFVSAQPRGFVLTGMAQIDVADRAAITERWGRMTVGGDGRDFGIDARWQLSRADIRVYVHNGDGSWDRARGNYREVSSAGSVTGGVNRSALAVSGSVALKPADASGLEVGGFAGYNGARNPNTARTSQSGRRYMTFGAHAYLGARPGSRALRLKLDLLGIQYEQLGIENDGQLVLGGALLGAARLAQGVELFARAELLDPNSHVGSDEDGYATLGATLSLSARRGLPFHRERLTLAWTRGQHLDPDTEAQDLIILQLQFWL